MRLPIGQILTKARFTEFFGAAKAAPLQCPATLGQLVRRKIAANSWECRNHRSPGQHLKLIIAER